MSDLGIIFSREDVGHKASYGRTLRKIYGFDVRHGRRSLRLLRELVATPNLIFSTLDDDYLTFFIVVAARALRGRPTTALFLRPQTCVADTRVTQRIKRFLFEALRRFKLANVLTIVSFEVEPRFAALATDWVYDPEFFDLDMKLPGNELPATQLSDETKVLAAGRAIVLIPGALVARKGFALLVEMLESDPQLCQRFLFVSAGRVHASAGALAARFSELGGLALGRFLSDQDLFSLYGVADYMWAAYAPEYDQSSGVFGRALQTSCPVIVRAGSLIEKLATGAGLPVISLPFDDAASARALLCEASPTRRSARGMAGIDINGNTERRARFIAGVDRGLMPDARVGGAYG